MPNPAKFKLLDNKVPLIFGALLVFVAGAAVGYLLPRPSAAPLGPAAETPAAVDKSAQNDSVFGHGLKAAVVVDGFEAAEPQSGLHRMPLVFEFPAEAAIPRYLGFVGFLSEGGEDFKIGPIRSLRPYFLDAARGFGVTVAHVGGSPAAMSAVKTQHLSTLDQYFQSQYFYRRSDRKAPHNVYTSISLLSSAAQDKMLPDGMTPDWKFLAESSKEEDNKNRAEKIIIPHIDPAYVVEWVYQPANGSYRRLQGGKEHLMEDGAVLEVKNVAVVWTEIKILDAVGRREIHTTGSGKAQLFRNGLFVDGEWRREDGKPFEFFDQNGQPWQFAPGKIWVHVLGTGEEVRMEK